jgi:hypothetical protein
VPLEPLHLFSVCRLRLFFGGTRQIGTKQLIQIGLFAQIDANHSILRDFSQCFDHRGLANARTALEHDGQVHDETTHDSHQVRSGCVRVEAVGESVVAIMAFSRSILAFENREWATFEVNKLVNNETMLTFVEEFIFSFFRKIK